MQLSQDTLIVTIAKHNFRRESQAHFFAFLFLMDRKGIFYMEEDMKNIKKIITIILLLLLAVLATACDPTEFVTDTIEVIQIPSGEYEYLENLLVALSDAETIELDYSTSEFGIFVTLVKGSSITLASSDSESTYVSIYLNTLDAELVDTAITPIMVNDENYYPAALGASDLPVIEGVKYLFCTVTYGADWSSTVNEAFIILE